jgi:hypothetical protein
MKLKCGCVIEHYEYDETGIDFCPMHEAAPYLLEACKVVAEMEKFLSKAVVKYDPVLLPSFARMMATVREAILKAALETVK